MNYKETIAKMTLEEKCYILSGRDFWSTYSFPEKGIPSINLADGPHGIRKQEGAGDQLGLNASLPATCFPTAAAVASRSLESALTGFLIHRQKILSTGRCVMDTD